MADTEENPKAAPEAAPSEPTAVSQPSAAGADAASAAPAAPAAAPAVSASSPPAAPSSPAAAVSPKSATSSAAGRTSASPRAASSSPAAAAAVEASADAPIDAEEAFDDNDSALGDSGVVDYPVEYGRRYHAYQHGRYSRPNDELEMDRLLIMHTVITLATGSLFRAPVNMDEPQQILDIGTGNGVWAIEMADQYPNATIIGNDLSANMPTFVPPNVKFEVDDVENEWVYEQPFTFIFSRYMAASIGDWPKLVQNAYNNLAPGGWAEFQDFDLTYYSEDGSLKADNPLMVWINTMCNASRNMGRDPCPGSKLEGWFRDAGFTNIVHKRYRLPLGPWPRDPHLKEIGLHNYMQVNQGLEGLSLRLFMNVLKWKLEETMVMLAEVRKSLHDPNIHTILDYHVVYGQRPE
ncbi:tam domain protein [Niveomyces insectorum RCEF 264]|uniref:Tam domain protein n=1 Tax=Niveomyces insectorum RCEF 264 TaxID=1081102 RepID=A0A167Y2X6_9HYPO|nr:tam domain protein [Niveomyces insectorum RCEF 264]